MKSSKRSYVVVAAAVLLSLNPGMLNARDLDSLKFAAAQTVKQQCMSICRARYRSCFSLKQIPSFECRGVYQDCTQFTCNAAKG